MPDGHSRLHPLFLRLHVSRDAIQVRFLSWFDCVSVAVEAGSAAASEGKYLADLIARFHHFVDPLQISIYVVKVPSHAMMAAAFECFLYLDLKSEVSRSLHLVFHFFDERAGVNKVEFATRETMIYLIVVIHQSLMMLQIQLDSVAMTLTAASFGNTTRLRCCCMIRI